MIINGSGFTISLVPKDAISTVTINGKTFPLSYVGHTVIIDGKSKDKFAKKFKYNRDLEQTKARMNQMLGR